MQVSSNGGTGSFGSSSWRAKVRDGDGLDSNLVVGLEDAIELQIRIAVPEVYKCGVVCGVIRETIMLNRHHKPNQS